MVPSVKWLQYKRRDLNSDPQHSCKEASVAACVCKLSFDGSRTAASPEAHCPASLTKSVSSSFGEKPVSKNTGEGHLRKTLPFPKHVHVHGHSNTNKKQDPLFWHYLFVCGGYWWGVCLPTPTHTLQTYGGQRTSFSNPFAPSNMWDLGMKLRLSGLAGNTFTHWAILTAPMVFI